MDDINNKKEFHKWINKFFKYADDRSKQLMWEAWCKSAKVSRDKKND